MFRRFVLIACVLTCLTGSWSSGHASGAEAGGTRITDFSGLGAKHRLDASLGSIPSQYAQPLIALSRDWQDKPVTIGEGSGTEVRLECYETPADPFYIGVGQQMRIAAPWSQVVRVVDDLPRYRELFHGLIRSEAESADGNLVLTAWEERVPVPFVPNIRSRMIYLVSQPRDGLRLYRYGLKESNHLTRSDGVIILQAQGESTLYSEFDFFDADWGVLKALGADHAWRESLEGLYQTDLAFKLRAEHPDWELAQIRAKSEALAGRASFDRCLAGKKRFVGTIP